MRNRKFWQAYVRRSLVDYFFNWGQLWTAIKCGRLALIWYLWSTLQCIDLYSWHFRRRLDAIVLGKWRRWKFTDWLLATPMSERCLTRHQWSWDLIKLCCSRWELKAWKMWAHHCIVNKCWIWIIFKSIHTPVIFGYAFLTQFYFGAALVPSYVTARSTRP